MRARLKPSLGRARHGPYVLTEMSNFYLLRLLSLSLTPMAARRPPTHLPPSTYLSSGSLQGREGRGFRRKSKAQGTGHRTYRSYRSHRASGLQQAVYEAGHSAIMLVKLAFSIAVASNLSTVALQLSNLVCLFYSIMPSRQLRAAQKANEAEYRILS